MDGKRRLMEVSLYWSRSTASVLVPLMESVMRSYLVMVSGVLSQFVNGFSSSLVYNELNQFMKFTTQEAQFSEREWAEVFSICPGAWAFLPRPSFEHCLTVNAETWYGECLQASMSTWVTNTLALSVDTRMAAFAESMIGESAPNDEAALVAGSADLQMVLDSLGRAGASAAQQERLRLLVESRAPAPGRYPGAKERPLYADGKPMPFMWEQHDHANGELRSSVPEDVEYALNSFHNLVLQVFGAYDVDMKTTALERHGAVLAILAQQWHDCLGQLLADDVEHLAFICVIANDCLRMVEFIETHEPDYEGGERALNALGIASDVFIRLGLQCVRRIAWRVHVDVEMDAADKQCSFTSGWRLAAAPAAAAPPAAGDRLVDTYMRTLRDYWTDIGGGRLQERLSERVATLLASVLCKRYLFDVRVFCENSGALAQMEAALEARGEAPSGLSGPSLGLLAADLGLLAEEFTAAPLRLPLRICEAQWQPLQLLEDIVDVDAENFYEMMVKAAAGSARVPRSFARFVYYALSLRPGIDTNVVLQALRALRFVANAEAPPVPLDIDRIFTLDGFVDAVLEVAPPERWDAAIVPKGLPEARLPLITLGGRELDAFQAVFGDTYHEAVRRHRDPSAAAGAAAGAKGRKGAKGDDAAAAAAGEEPAAAVAGAQDGAFVVRVEVIRATGLKRRKSGLFGAASASPFIGLTLESPELLSSQTGRTAAKYYTDEPTWNEAFDMVVPGLFGAVLKVTAIDDMLLASDEQLGAADVDISDLTMETKDGRPCPPRQITVKLEPQGSVYLSLSLRRNERRDAGD